MNNSTLQHHGILGMKWGIRRYQPYPKGHSGGKEVGEAAKARQLKKEQKKYDKKVKKNWVKAYNETVDYTNKVLIPQINAKYEKKYGSDWYREASKNNSKEYQSYTNEYKEMFSKKYSEISEQMFGKRPE